MGGEVRPVFVSKGGAWVGLGGRDVPSGVGPSSDDTFLTGVWTSGFWGGGPDGLGTLVPESGMGEGLLDLDSAGR